MSTFLISREVELPLLATQYESECFAYVVNRFDLFEDLTSEIKELTLLKITNAAKKCLGEATTTEICGSYAKKTNISGSDIDVYVDTVDPVNLDKRKELTMHLKSVFDHKHVSLGIKSITVFNGFFDVDVVCSNTVEFGVLPRADTTIAANCPANLAIRALKFVIKHARSDKVPGHLLEKFVQFVQSMYPIRNPLGGGGFQLFISILQHVVDCEPSKIVGLPGGTGASANIHRIAVTLVHQYVVSRTLNTTFRSNAEVFGWLNLTVDNDAVETAVGTVPSWLLSLDGMPSPSSPSIGVFKQYSLGGIRTVERSEGHVPFSLNLMLHQPIAKYTLKGKVELNSNNLDHEMRTLQMHARKGSVVARNMCASRCLWHRGLDRMLKSKHFEAIQDFGESMRLQTIHSDPFSGFFTTDLIPIYRESVRIVLSSHPTNIDALLLCARIHIVSNEFKQCSEVLETAYKLYPDDCYGTISNLGLCFGNTSQWKRALPLFDRCVLLCPLEPIFYYWRAVARKNCIGKLNSSAHELKDAIDDLIQYFHLKPAPEGRKVANAWYELALFRFMYNTQTTVPDRENTFMKDMHCAMKAEENILPMFRPVITDSKKLTESLFERISTKSPQLNVASSINKLKEIGNAEFKKGEFSVAVDYYTKALEISAGNVDILNNRSAAYSKLCYFSRALEDAEKARDIARESIKSYFRIMTAALGKRKPLIALTAARSALEIQPNEETILKLQLQAETMISELSTSISESTFQYDPTDYQSAPCWSSVLYKNRVFVVDELGRTDFANIEDAVFEASNQHDGNGTTIILLPGKYSTNQLEIASDNKNILSIQIMGWSFDDKGTVIELTNPMHCTLIVISGKCNVQISNCLLRQPFGFPTQAGNCVVCKESAVVIIEKSRLENPDTPCCAVMGENSIIEMNDCTISKASAVVVSAYDGLFRAKRCSIKGCYKAAIEIRERGSADLTDCMFNNCTAQAVLLYSRGKMLTMLRCKLTYCGKQLQHSAILIETGQAIITESEIRNCPGDAVVVQERVNAEQIQETDPQLIMKKCIIEHNKSGVCFYHGYGIISESKFNFNALHGLAVYVLSSNRKLVVTGNTFLRNGVEKKVDFLVQGKTLFDNAVVLRNDNDFSVAPYIVPDKLASAMRDKLLQMVHREGMR